MIPSTEKRYPNLYKAFEQEVMVKGLRDIRLSAAISSIAFLLFNILDRILYPDLFATFFFIRLTVVAGNSVIILLTFLKNSYRHSRLLKMLAYVIYSASIIIMVHLTGGYTSPYYAGLNIVLIGFMFLLPLDGGRTIIVCIVVYSGYLAPILFLQDITDVSVFLNNNFFLTTTMVLAIASSYLSTAMHLKEFAARHNLAQANDELKELDRMKTQFFANVSHEVRTPLTSIIAPLQSLRQGDVGTTTADQAELLEQMHRNAIRLLDLINQMLDFSKLEAGKVNVRLSLINVVEFTEDIATLFLEVTARKGLMLTINSDNEAKDEIYIDRDRYERILTNLIRNAIKFTEKGSIRIYLTKKGHTLKLQVSDTGIGIPQSHLAQIFHRFEQVDNTTTRPYEGTGLGLAIVKESADLMQSEIHVESEVNRGTTFTLLIPDNLNESLPDAFIERRNSDRRDADIDWNGQDRRDNERRRSDYSQVPVSQLAQIETQSSDTDDETTETDETIVRSNQLVLVTEDNDDLRRYITKILKRMGHRVITAHDGLEAWNIIESGKPVEILISDVMMPKMDGYELLEKIRNNTETLDLPVIMITAKPGDDPKFKALGIGANDYLPKPINVRELDARIRNILTGRELQRVAAQTEVLDQRIEELRLSFAQSLEIRDTETGNHCREVLAIGTTIAGELGLEIDQTLKDSLLLHDIGKIGIPDRILLKDSPLNEEEMAEMQRHAELGKKLLESFSNFREVSDIILAHQEHWDGTGYPRGLSGDKIPLIARIIAVADAYHAMTNNRPYRRALSHDEALMELVANRGTQFDPSIVDAFIKTEAQNALANLPDSNRSPHKTD